MKTERSYKDKVLNLKRSLYGLKEAAKTWYETVSAQFRNFGVRDIKAAPCVLIEECIVVSDILRRRPLSFLSSRKIGRRVQVEATAEV